MTARRVSPEDRGAGLFRSRLGAAALLVPAIALAGCSSEGGRPGARGEAGAGGEAADTERMEIAMVTHAPPGDTFWDIVRQGAEAAAAQDNAELLYASDPEASQQAQLVQQYIDQGVDGIAVTLSNPGAMSTALQDAEEAGIPVVALNAGMDEYEELGAFAYFGSNEQLAGEAVGERLQQKGLSHPICVIQDQGHIGLENRCAGVKNVLPETEILYVEGTDMTQVASTATAKLQTSQAADSVVGLGAPITMTLLGSREQAGSDVAVASFDLDGELAQAIADGDVLFTVDQQPWLQGYMSVDSLWQNEFGGFQIGGGRPVLTGPAIVDADNADEVLENAQEGIR